MSAEKAALQQASIPRTSTPLLKLLWRVYKYLRPYWKSVLVTYLSLFAILALNTLRPAHGAALVGSGFAGAYSFEGDSQLLSGHQQ
jgi:hypothetical protein